MTHEDFSLRLATAADLTPMAALAEELVRYHHALDPIRFFLVDGVAEGYREWFAQELARAKALLLVAVGPTGALLGYAYGRDEPRDWNLLLDRHAVLHDVMVREDARRLGVGRALLASFCERMRERGAPRVVLHTAHGNERAQAMFREAGFRPTMIELTLEL